MRWRAIPLPDRVAVVRLANALRRGRFNEPVADATATRWLESQGQSASVRRWLWNPLAFAALNQSPDEAAAAPFVRVLKELIGTRLEDSAIGLPIAPLDDMLAIPAAREIAQLGGQILNGRPARVQLDTEGAIAGVTTRDATIRASTVVSAVPWHALAGLWERGCPPPLAHIAATAERMSSSPIVTVNLWFDRQVLPQRFVGLPDGAVHWVFDKQAIFGGRAGHLTAVASGASELAVKDQDEITAIALGDLNRAVPSSRPARLLRSLVVRERRATFSLVPGQPLRPATRTPLAGFFLAGDWIDTGLPATIESAVRSGHAAAEAVLDLAVRRAG
jgi:squalene-associated FAD-dependent desaturase